MIKPNELTLPGNKNRELSWKLNYRMTGGSGSFHKIEKKKSDNRKKGKPFSGLTLQGPQNT